MERHVANASAVARFLAGARRRRARSATRGWPTATARAPAARPSRRARCAWRRPAFGGMVSFVPAPGGVHGRTAAERAIADLRVDPAVHPRRVARRRGVADRDPGGDDPHVGRRRRRSRSTRRSSACRSASRRADDLIADLAQALDRRLRRRGRRAATARAAPRHRDAGSVAPARHRGANRASSRGRAPSADHAVAMAAGVCRGRAGSPGTSPNGPVSARCPTR